jgi:hypothetical protein
MAVMGMSANPIGAHQVVRHMVGRWVDGIEFAQMCNRGVSLLVVRRKHSQRSTRPSEFELRLLHFFQSSGE